MEPLTGDRLDGFLEATEQANAIPQPQAWNGIDGLLNGKPFMPEYEIGRSSSRET